MKRKFCWVAVVVLMVGVVSSLWWIVSAGSSGSGSHLAPVTVSPGGPLKPGPLRLASADFDRTAGELDLVFEPDLGKFDLTQVAIEVKFLERRDGLWVDAPGHPVYDWSLWKLPLVGNKPRRLKMTSVGAFERMAVEISYRGDRIDSRTFEVR